MSKRIQLNTIDLGGGTTKGCDCEAPNLGDYAKKDDVPKKVSELENDSGFVENNSLGTAAYVNVKDLQGGNMTLVNSKTGKIDDTYVYQSISELGEKLFLLEFSLTSSTPYYHIVDINGNTIKRDMIGGKSIVHQEQLGTSLYKITYSDTSTASEKFSNTIISTEPIGYIILGAFTDVMPSIAIEGDNLSYFIKEYA